jgi:uncharacterized membrane protein YheB (UPF0754 family)
LLKALARREDFLEAQLNHLFDQVLLEFQLSEEQANQLVNWLLTVVIPPDVLRQGLTDFLTDRTIQVIDESFRQKSSGTYWVVANLFGVRNSLTRLRAFCLDEKSASNAILADLIRTLNIRQRGRDWLRNQALQNLPVSTVRQLRKTLRDSVRKYLQERGPELLQGLSASVDWEAAATVVLTRMRNSEALSTSLDLLSQELALILERYLEKDLGPIVAQAIPILKIDQVIIERIKATPPEDLEAGINDLVRTELQAIVNLGGVLGVLIGLLQAATLLLR